MATPVQSPQQNPAVMNLMAKIKAAQSGGRPNLPGMMPPNRPPMPSPRPPMPSPGPQMPSPGPQMGQNQPPGMPNIPPEMLAKLLQMKAGQPNLAPEMPMLPEIPENIMSTLTIDDLIQLLMESAKQEQGPPPMPTMPPRINPPAPVKVMPPGPQNIAPMSGPTNPMPQPNPMMKPGGM